MSRALRAGQLSKGADRKEKPEKDPWTENFNNCWKDHRWVIANFFWQPSSPSPVKGLEGCPKEGRLRGCAASNFPWQPTKGGKALACAFFNGLQSNIWLGRVR
jgi:hypothetical protein